MIHAIATMLLPDVLEFVTTIAEDALDEGLNEDEAEQALTVLLTAALQDLGDKAGPAAPLIRYAAPSVAEVIAVAIVDAYEARSAEERAQRREERRAKREARRAARKQARAARRAGRR